MIAPFQSDKAGPESLPEVHSACLDYAAGGGLLSSPGWAEILIHERLTPSAGSDKIKRNDLGLIYIFSPKGKNFMLQRPISRREMLKILLAAGGGLSAAAFLPAQWLKPMVSTGVLPAHARASAPGCILIADADIAFEIRKSGPPPNAHWLELEWLNLNDLTIPDGLDVTWTLVSNPSGMISSTIPVTNASTVGDGGGTGSGETAVNSGGKGPGTVNLLDQSVYYTKAGTITVTFSVKGYSQCWTKNFSVSYA